MMMDGPLCCETQGVSGCDSPNAHGPAPGQGTPTNLATGEPQGLVIFYSVYCEFTLLYVVCLSADRQCAAVACFLVVVTQNIRLNLHYPPHYYSTYIVLTCCDQLVHMSQVTPPATGSFELLNTHSNCPAAGHCGCPSSGQSDSRTLYHSHRDTQINQNVNFHTYVARTTLLLFDFLGKA